MSNCFGGFTVTSPISSTSHNPLHDLRSNCIRDYFGPTCQTVADCLVSRGICTVSDLLVYIRYQCKRDVNSERLKLVHGLDPLRKGRKVANLNLARGSEDNGFVVDASAVNAALIVLIQHSLVKVIAPSKPSNGGFVKYKYMLDAEQSLYLQRYPRFVEYAKKMFQETGAAIVEELLANGRMTGSEAIKGALAILENLISGEMPKEERKLLIQKIVDTFQIMVESGYVENVLPIDFSSSNSNSSSSDSQVLETNPSFAQNEIDDEINVHLQNTSKTIFADGAVWRVNVRMFHSSLRAFYLGRLVAERYDQIQFSGAVVSSVLKFIAAKEFSRKFQSKHRSEDEKQMLLAEKNSFTAYDIMDFLPPMILSDFKNKAGGALVNLSSLLSELSTLIYPPVLEEIEEANGHPQGGKFEIATRPLLSYLKDRIFHQVVKDHFGDTAARICSILGTKGHLESDAIADSAMVPAKEARECLHQLYKANYISMLYLHQSKQHNPANALYLWCIDKRQMEETVLKNISCALLNLRLRRQHEVEQGKDWIERAKLAGNTDENDSEMDKINYNKFCQGLERLDNACLQLDETLMILLEFDK